MAVTELAAAAAHAANNAGALLEAAMVFIDDAAGSSQLVQGNAILAAGMARVRTLAAALNLLALEPAHVARVLAVEPFTLGAMALERLRDRLACEPQLAIAACPPLPDAYSRIDGTTLHSILTCLVECLRRRLPETHMARLSWSDGQRSAPPDPARPVRWVFDITVDDTEVPAGPSVALHPPRVGITEQALTHAGSLLAPLGVHIEAGHGDRYRLVLESVAWPRAGWP